MIDLVFLFSIVLAFIFGAISMSIFRTDIFYENVELRREKQRLNERLAESLRGIKLGAYCSSIWHDAADGARFRLSSILQELGMIKDSVESMQKIARSGIEGIDAIESDADEVCSDSGFVGESDSEESGVSNAG